MRGPSLQKTTALSLVLHLTVFLIAFLLLKQSGRFVIPPPFTVSLVGPDILTGIDRSNNTDAVEASKESAVPADIATKNLKEISRGKELVEEKISAIAAKKRVEKFVRLRSMISLKASGERRGAKANTAVTKSTFSASGKSSMFDDYYSRIMQEIWQQWSWDPGKGGKNLEAIISIKILRDGTTLVQKIEKSSGNPLFDRLATRALAKASPLPPPPYEMEIGVRFYP